MHLISHLDEKRKKRAIDLPCVGTPLYLAEPRATARHRTHTSLAPTATVCNRSAGQHQSYGDNSIAHEHKITTADKAKAEQWPQKQRVATQHSVQVAIDVHIPVSESCPHRFCPRAHWLVRSCCATCRQPCTQYAQCEL